MRSNSHDRVQDYSDKFKVDFYPGKRPWGVKCDIAFPCACENEMDVENAKALVRKGCMCVTECANRSLTPDAIEFLLENNNILYSPGKTSNAGGGACAGLEMAQNSTKIKWTKEEVLSHIEFIQDEIEKILKEYENRL